MLRNGLLVLSTTSVHGGGSVLSSLIESCVKTVCNLLYVHLVSYDVTDSSHVSFGGVLCSQSVRHFVSNFYTKAATLQQSLEVRFLLSNICNRLPQFPILGPQRLQYGYEVVLTDLGHDLHQAIANYVMTQFPVNRAVEVVQLPVDVSSCHSSASSDDNVVTTYPAVCLGGTFDHMHVGHRLLLNEACLLTTQTVTVGVTDGPMNNKKVLNELMQPINDRLDSVWQFASDIKPDLQYNIVPITDPFGPAVTDSQLECIVVSAETVRGANSINVKRAEQGMKQLEIQVIDLVADPHHDPHDDADEEKISSSSTRKRLLGTLLRPPLKERTFPYIIGLTGSTASGKSSVCARLERLGAMIVNCDKLGHKSYEPGTPTYQQILSVFGHDLVTSEGHIDRQRLASRVFSQKDELEKLNGIVWPAIRQLAEEEIASAANSGHSIVVLDAAVLLEAGWDDIVHEVWTTVIPLDEAVRRLAERSGMAEEEAMERLKSQMSSEKRVARANVVLCTLWHTDVTQRQVEKAWHLLQSRLNDARMD